MADGLKIEIDQDQAEQLKAAAKERGVEPADFARQLRDQALEDAADRTEIERRWKNYDASGETIDHVEIIEMLKSIHRDMRAASVLTEVDPDTRADRQA